MQSVVGQISSPTFSRTPYVISADGRPLVLPSVGGITYNVRVGDPAIGWAADHVEPGVSMVNTEKSMGSWSPNSGLNTLACAGNEATVISGDAKGAKGTVIGKHGGIDHVIVDFSPAILGKMVVGDKMQVKAYGTGMILANYYPEIHAMNLSPDLLSKIPVKETKSTLTFPVTHIVPAAIMGSGHGLGTLRFGDFVAITDADHSYGRIYKTGAVSIGIVVHSDCVIAGHGPGVMTVLTSGKGKIKPVINKKSNIVNYLKLK
jgi:hypothetical protein